MSTKHAMTERQYLGIEKTYLGIDLGTSACKCALYDAEGRLLAAETEAYPLLQPEAAWAEQDPEAWWQAIVRAIRNLLSTLDLSPYSVAGIGLSGQMHGLVLLDEAGEILRPCIIWADQRTAEEVAWMEAEFGRDFWIEHTANPPITGFTAAKWLWVKRHEPDIAAKTRHILLPKDYIRYRLSAAWATDVSDASGTQFFNVAERNWDLTVLELLKIPEAYLPKVYESVELTGELSEEAASLTGLAVGTPIVAGAGDNAAAALSCAVVEEGLAFTTIGSSGVVFAQTDCLKVDPKGRLHSFCAAVPGTWHVMGVTQAAGLSLRWFRDQMAGQLVAEAEKAHRSVYAYLDELAEQVPLGAEGLFYLPYLMGERTPHLDPDARGVFFGLSARHDLAACCRAILEGVAYSQLDSLELIRAMGIQVEDMRATGGGASPLWQQILADMYACPVRRLRGAGGPALGAAMLAAVATGAAKSVPEISKAWVNLDVTAEPDEARHAAYGARYVIYKKLYKQLAPLYKEAAKLAEKSKA